MRTWITLTFELEIQSGSGRDHPVVVLRSPAGEARATMRFPFDQLDLESRLDKLQIALLRSGGKRRDVLSPDQQSVQDFGRALFDAVFAGEVRSRYDVSCERAAQKEPGTAFKTRTSRIRSWPRCPGSSCTTHDAQNTSAFLA